MMFLLFILPWHARPPAIAGHTIATLQRTDMAVIVMGNNDDDNSELPAAIARAHRWIKAAFHFNLLLCHGSLTYKVAFQRWHETTIPCRRGRWSPLAQYHREVVSACQERLPRDSLKLQREEREFFISQVGNAQSSV